MQPIQRVPVEPLPRPRDAMVSVGVEVEQRQDDLIQLGSVVFHDYFSVRITTWALSRGAKRRRFQRRVNLLSDRWRRCPAEGSRRAGMSFSPLTRNTGTPRDWTVSHRVPWPIDRLPEIRLTGPLSSVHPL